MSRSYRVGVIPGDGTGPEVIAEGLKVLAAIMHGFDVETVPYLIGISREVEA